MDELQGQWTYYIGLDPGLTGGIGMVSADGSTAKAWDIPIGPSPEKTKTSKKKKWYDVDGMYRLFCQLSHYPNVIAGLEWPQVHVNKSDHRKSWSPDRTEKLGIGKGYLEALLVATGIPYLRVSPNLWKGKIDLPGKTKKAEANATCAAFWETSYPDFADIIRGPQGGLKDGRMDALLIAHFLRCADRKLDF